jgi:hypothetical protein
VEIVKPGIDSSISPHGMHKFQFKIKDDIKAARKKATEAYEE